ncbi:hypothetical protein GCM10012275_39600 [Longimycelium tulufanense]|uniref:Uncharacterized protein n=1 Tax=Longimycelium tulufanense TaxID=907463 RepID=A0A8J3CDY5_9PSEU|nr:hypothetical protein [Longimycelium tulufanense]GGM65131.1 hypothetical protein GCM10012275_39600 [Longimycelium tulufanense]
MTFADRLRNAYDEGRRAAQNRQPGTNPYRPTGTTPRETERALAVAWRSGYQSVTKQFPIDYSG